MHQQIVIKNSTALLGVMCLMWAAPIMAQDEDKLRVPLKINEDYKQTMGYLIEFSGDTEESAYSLPEAR